MGNTIRQERDEHQTFRPRDQVALVACLLGGVQDDIHLSLLAVLGLTELFQDAAAVETSLTKNKKPSFSWAF